MPAKSLGDKLGRQVENIKGGLKDVAHKLTEADPEPRTDATAGRISGARAGSSSRARKRTPSKDELYADAKRLGIKGRSKMTKDELLKALRRG
ncbi:Rho termination factor [Kribbella shirazensis]|uniref:Rho termination factor n=1 Tax=Kribbella shirazensis TaxID=1105143 RepID=A0A7X6A308_9ACTN|nr:Rho termination factor [Kribbella shirazensis]NIK59826.1 hypothetical protein [Kribbella shirazensis]